MTGKTRYDLDRSAHAVYSHDSPNKWSDPMATLTYQQRIVFVLRSSSLPLAHDYRRAHDARGECPMWAGDEL